MRHSVSMIKGINDNIYEKQQNLNSYQYGFTDERFILFLPLFVLKCWAENIDEGCTIDAIKDATWTYHH